MSTHGSKNGLPLLRPNCGFLSGSCRHSQCCESTAEERWCGKSARHVLGNRGRATASGDPVSSPSERATADTLPPGENASATSRAFSSSDRWRGLRRDGTGSARQNLECSMMAHTVAHKSHGLDDGRRFCKMILRMIHAENERSTACTLRGDVGMPARLLNPVENLWPFMRENWLCNRIFKSYADIVDHCCDAWHKLESQPWRIMSVGRRNWANGF